MDAEGDELLAEREHLNAAGGELPKRDEGAVEEPPLWPEADPYERRLSEGRPEALLHVVSRVGIEDADVGRDEVAGAQADAALGELAAPLLDLLAVHGRFAQRLLCVAEPARLGPCGCRYPVFQSDRGDPCRLQRQLRCAWRSRRAR
jgi:hypothetical protein